ncbi:hypothetical protein SLEP1_g36343 [Rubroshorea leprosula]|uniref:Uncharacterized protein n=1 Tax=Rubroshorea leprosula TaxID=152421 RepID=A0AAV5KR77_9ROSI|nr:hypothetical protein SLEP1_g36343 [Rubroshorea leprosula]
MNLDHPRRNLHLLLLILPLCLDWMMSSPVKSGDGGSEIDAADPKSIAKRLEELGFSHESAERACPALTQYVHPLQVALRQPDSRKRQRLPFLDVPFRILHEELHQLAAIRFNQTCPDPDSDPDP